MFLNGVIEEEIYIEKPKIFEVTIGKLMFVG
jgi:hypothetical protein